MFRFYKALVAVVLISCLAFIASYFGIVNSKASNFSTRDFEPAGAIGQQAWQLAKEVVGASRSAQEQFVAELLALYDKVKGKDIVVFCNSGGWGTKPLSADYQGQSWLNGINNELTQMGYKYCIIENIRTGSGLIERLFELKEHLTHYPVKAKRLAVKIDFLTRHVTDLKVLITGQSAGAAFAGEVAKYLECNPRVYSIQVGIPFWQKTEQVSNSLVIASSGISADVLAEKDLVSFFKANLGKLFVIGHAPSFTPIDWFTTKAIIIFALYDFGFGLEAPGHEYMWEYPGVGPAIKAFLVEHFGSQ